VLDNPVRQTDSKGFGPGRYDTHRQSQGVSTVSVECLITDRVTKQFRRHKVFLKTKSLQISSSLYINYIKTVLNRIFHSYSIY